MANWQKLVLASNTSRALVWQNRHEINHEVLYYYTVSLAPVNEAGSFRFGRDGKRLSYVDDVFLGVEVSCGNFVQGSSLRLMRQRNGGEGESGSEFTSNEDGSLSPIQALHLVLGIARVTQDCEDGNIYDLSVGEQYTGLTLVAKGSADHLVMRVAYANEITMRNFTGTGMVNHSGLVISAGSPDSAGWEIAELTVWKEQLSIDELKAAMQYYKLLYSSPSGRFWIDKKWGKIPLTMTTSHIRDSEMNSTYCAAADQLPCVAPSGRLCTGSFLSEHGRQALGVDSQLLSPYRVAFPVNDPMCTATVTCSGCGCNTSEIPIGYGSLSDGSGSSQYNNGVKCIFNISLDDGLECGDIVVHFESFQTEAGFDTVEIDMGPDHPAQVLSGHVSQSREFRSTAGFMQIVFASVIGREGQAQTGRKIRRKKGKEGAEK